VTEAGIEPARGD